MLTPQPADLPIIEVLLTFDDGPVPQALGTDTFTERVLNILEARQAKAAFFIQVHSEMPPRADTPEGSALVARMRDQGHVVALHTGSLEHHAEHIGRVKDDGVVDGQDFLFLDFNDALDDGRKALAWIQEHAGVPAQFVRPPKLLCNPAVRAVYHHFGLKNIRIDIDPRDWDFGGLGIQGICDKIRTDMALRIDGGLDAVIVLFHDTISTTVTNLEQFLAAIEQGANESGRTARFVDNTGRVIEVMNEWAVRRPDLQGAPALTTAALEKHLDGPVTLSGLEPPLAELELLHLAAQVCSANELLAVFVRKPGLAVSTAVRLVKTIPALPAPNCAKALTDLVGDAKIASQLRVAAAETLSKLQAREAIPVIQNLLLGTTLEPDQARLLDALAGFKEKELSETFRRVVNDPQHSNLARVAAAGGLAVLGDPDGQHFLLQAFRKAGGESDEYPYERIMGLLFETGLPEARRLLGTRLFGLAQESMAVMERMKQDGAAGYADELTEFARTPGSETVLRLAALKTLIAAWEQLAQGQRQQVAEVTSGVLTEAASLDTQTRRSAGDLRDLVQSKGLGWILNGTVAPGPP